jgi:hypothetical protein
MSPDDAPREHFSNLADPPWSIVAGGQVLGTGNTGTDAWRAVLAAAEAERDALRARAEAAEATASRLNAANVRLMRRLAPTLSALVASTNELAKMGQRAVAAEAALATARAEGAAVERAAVLGALRAQLAYAAPRGWPEAVEMLEECIEDIEAGAHVRPVEGA